MSAERASSSFASVCAGSQPGFVQALGQGLCRLTARVCAGSQPGFVQALGQGLCRLSARVCAGSWPGFVQALGQVLRTSLFLTTSTGSTTSSYNNRRMIPREVGDQAHSRRFVTSTMLISWPFLDTKDTLNWPGGMCRDGCAAGVPSTPTTTWVALQESAAAGGSRRGAGAVLAAVAGALPGRCAGSLIP